MLTAALLALLACSAAAEPKHVILLFTDEQDGRTVDPTHPLSRVVETPAFSRLAKNGANFIRTYTPSPQCVPGRVATFTSKHTFHSHAWSNGQGLAADSKTGKIDPVCLELYDEMTCKEWAADQAKSVKTTLDRSLEDMGVNVSLIGKVDVGATVLSRFPLAWASGFHGGPSIPIVSRASDVRRATKGTPQSLINWNKPNGSFPKDWVSIDETVHAVDHWKEEFGDQDVFLYSSVLTPHPPMHTSVKWLDKVNQTALRAALPKFAPFDTYHPFDSYESISKHADTIDDEVVFNVSLSYFSDVAIADYMHGEVLAALDRNNLTDSAYVIFISDHGEMHSEHRQLWKNSFYEASGRVPLVVMGPGIEPQQITSYTTLLDVFPTIIELQGGTVPPGLDGQSLVPRLFKDEATARAHGVSWKTSGLDFEERPAISSYFSNLANTNSFMVAQHVDGAEMKLMTYGNAFPWFNATSYHPQLFNLSADPGEHNDLSKELPDVVAQLTAELEKVSGPIQQIDVTNKLNDQHLFKRFFADKDTPQELRKHLESSYQGFDDSDMAKITRWMNATPEVAPATA